MNIAFVCNEYPPAKGGGIGPSVRALARGLVRLGHGVVVLGLYDRDSVEDDEGVVVYRYRFPLESIPKRVLLSRRFLHGKLRQVCERRRIDIVEWPDFQGMYHRPIPGVADVVKLHGTTLSHRVHGLIRYNPIAQALWERQEKRTLLSIPHWIGVSRWFLDEWKQYFRFAPRTEGVVYNPVDTATFRPPSANAGRENVVFFSGAFRKRKGIASLVSAARVAFDRGLDFRLVLMGYEAEFSRGELLRLAAGHEQRIEFLPFSDQSGVADWMRRAKVFAMPSYYESCGNGWLEAAACGTPSIGSLRSCGPEVVRDCVDGILVDPDRIDGIADAIARLVTDDRLWHGMSVAAAQSAAARFSTEVCSRRSVEIYRSVLEAEGCAAAAAA